MDLQEEHVYQEWLDSTRGDFVCEMCGNGIDEDYKYCKHCGEFVEGEYEFVGAEGVGQ